mmetsp:Transcript_2855/g.9669  ORF Transcript_2855/g.9669 Transcript_2855/m.9669 type:complete len:203 (+) Transcript_2855:817-1425(+)
MLEHETLGRVWRENDGRTVEGVVYGDAWRGGAGGDCGADGGVRRGGDGVAGGGDGGHQGQHPRHGQKKERDQALHCFPLCRTRRHRRLRGIEQGRAEAARARVANVIWAVPPCVGLAEGATAGDAAAAGAAAEGGVAGSRQGDHGNHAPRDLDKLLQVGLDDRVHALIPRARVQLRIVDDIGQHRVGQHKAEHLPNADEHPD